jgi:hypothetical protein
MRKRKEDFVWLHLWQCYGCNRVYVLPYNAGDDNGFQLVPTGKTNL